MRLLAVAFACSFVRLCVIIGLVSARTQPIPDEQLPNLTQCFNDGYKFQFNDFNTSLLGPHNDRLRANTSCELSVMLVWQIFREPVGASMLYPYNLVRNAAMLMARTELVAMIDVDFLPNTGFMHGLLADTQRLTYLTKESRHRAVFVLPAFYAGDCFVRRQMRPKVLALALATGSKEQLKELFEGPGPCAKQFGHPNLAVHGPSNYTQFFSTDRPYQVTVGRGYEPYFIANRFALPPYDVRFKGYGLDKCVYTQHLAAANFTFWVLPDAWVVHLLHSATQSALDFLTRKDGRVRVAMIKMGWEAYRAMDLGLYVPADDPAIKACRDSLPWWKDRRGAAWAWKQ